MTLCPKFAINISILFTNTKRTTHSLLLNLQLIPKEKVRKEKKLSIHKWKLTNQRFSLIWNFDNIGSSQLPATEPKSILWKPKSWNWNILGNRKRIWNSTTQSIWKKRGFWDGYCEKWKRSHGSKLWELCFHRGINSFKYLYRPQNLVVSFFFFLFLLAFLVSK